jgi:hypothetical protein
MSVVSIVKSVVGKGLKGEYYNFQYTFEDGVSISARHKTDAPKANVGEQGEYEIKFSNEWGNVGGVKKHNPDYPANSGGGQAPQQGTTYPVQSAVSAHNAVSSAPAARGGNSKNAAFALSYAKDVVIEKIDISGEGNPIENIAAATILIADKYLAWLDSK